MDLGSPSSKAPNQIDIPNVILCCAAAAVVAAAAAGRPAGIAIVAALALIVHALLEAVAHTATGLELAELIVASALLTVATEDGALQKATAADTCRAPAKTTASKVEGKQHRHD